MMCAADGENCDEGNWETTGAWKMVADRRLAEEGGWGLNGGWCKAIDGSRKAVGGRWKP